MERRKRARARPWYRQSCVVRRRLLHRRRHRCSEGAGRASRAGFEHRVHVPLLLYLASAVARDCRTLVGPIIDAGVPPEAPASVSVDYITSTLVIRSNGGYDFVSVGAGLIIPMSGAPRIAALNPPDGTGARFEVTREAKLRPALMLRIYPFGHTSSTCSPVAIPASLGNPKAPSTAR